MVTTDRKNGPEAKEKREKKSYEPPSIIYEGLISTRAGSPTSLSGESEGGASLVDPADLFGNGN